MVINYDIWKDYRDTIKKLIKYEMGVQDAKFWYQRLCRVRKEPGPLSIKFIMGTIVQNTRHLRAPIVCQAGGCAERDVKFIQLLSIWAGITRWSYLMALIKSSL